jgi:Glycosyl transferase family 2
VRVVGPAATHRLDDTSGGAQTLRERAPGVQVTLDDVVRQAPDGVAISAVIPAMNEAENIGWVLERLPAAIDEVVLVDGRSTDGTVEVARRVRPDVVVVHETRPGKGAALRAGVAAARGPIVVMLDADGSMDPGEIDGYVGFIREGHDLVKGSRFLPGAGTDDMTALRSAGNRGLLTLANALFRSGHTDLCYGYAAFRREAFLALELTADGFEIETQFFLRAARRGLRVAEIASYELPRRFGNSNLNTFRDGWRVLRTILAERLRTSRPALPAAPSSAPGVVQSLAAQGRSIATATLSLAASSTAAAARDVAGVGQQPGVVEIRVLPRPARQRAAAMATAGVGGVRSLDEEPVEPRGPRPDGSELADGSRDDAQVLPRERVHGSALVASASRLLSE